MTPLVRDRPDDRGPGGRDLGGLGRAGRCLRALRGRDAVPLRPLRVRRGRGASAARSTPGGRSTRSPRGPRSCGSARWSRRRASGTRRCWRSWPRPPTTCPAGAIELGMGTGWSEIEHTAYGFPFLSMKERMDVLEEQLEIVHDGHWGDGDVQLQGRRTTSSRTCTALPRPVQTPAPAADHGRRRRPARGAPRRPLRRRVQHGHADARRDRRAQGEHRRGVREGRPRPDPVHDHDRDA